MNNDERYAEKLRERIVRKAERQAWKQARRQRRGAAHSIKAPVMLITVGVLFAFQNFTEYGFERTWPVLLVMAGLLSLVGRVFEPPAPPVDPAAPPSWGTWPYPPTPPPAGEYRGTAYAQGPYSAQTPPPTGPPPERGPSNPGGRQ